MSAWSSGARDPSRDGSDEPAPFSPDLGEDDEKGAEEDEEEEVGSEDSSTPRTTSAEDVDSEDNREKEEETRSGETGEHQERTTGLVMDHHEIKKDLSGAFQDLRVTTRAAIQMCGALEYYTAELLDMAGFSARYQNKDCITPVHIQNVLRCDEEYCKMLGTMQWEGRESFCKEGQRLRWQPE